VPIDSILPLQAVIPEDLVDAVSGISLEEARKIVSAVHRLDCLPATVRMVRRSSLESVRAAGELPKLPIVSVRASQIDPFVKYALKTADGEVIETVRIPLERPGRFSVCVSSQSGCAYGCTFCATGRIGLRRNLRAWEIVEQVLTIRRSLDRKQRQKVHGIVFQGMGEPLSNLDNVLQAIRILCEPCAQAVDGRTITVCTAGIPQGIRRLAREAPKIRLGISIGSARPDVRRSLMPIDRAYPLDEVLEAAAEHAAITRLAPMWAVTPLAGFNDTEADAYALASHSHKFMNQTGMRPQIRIIRFNRIDEPGAETHYPSEDERESSFQKILRAEGCSAHKRYSGGADIRAACGQLAAACNES
jgi:23S rRNA (adenine2503-C2)-methyltransferase